MRKGPKRLMVALAMAGVGMMAAASPRGEGAVHADPCAIAALKQRYLACEALAITGGLGRGAIADCAVVYEDLKSAAFGGSFARLHAWFVIARDGPGLGDDMTGPLCAGGPER